MLADLGVTDVAVCGLAKRLEEVWLPAEPDPVILSRTSEGLYLLQRVRDEAHRFAITYHRQRRSTSMIASELDAVPGLGPARRAALLKHFGSLRKLQGRRRRRDRGAPRLRPPHRRGGAGRAARRRGGRRTARGAHRCGRRGGVGVMRAVSGTEPAGIEVALVSGLSGAGRSTAAKVLEDLGWFVVDNLPPELIATMVDLGARARGEITRIAVVMDVRSRAFTADLGAVIKDLDARGYRPRLLFLEATDAVLVRRFEQVRRSHPLQGDGRLVDGIAAERELLRPLRESADLVVDTSTVSVPQLRATLERAFGDGVGTGHARHGGVVRLQVRAADGLRPRGRRALPAQPVLDPGAARPRPAATSAVRDYVLSQEGAEEFIDRYLELLRLVGAGLPARGQALPDGLGRLHRRQAPQRRDQRGARAPAGGRRRASRSTSRTATWGASERPGGGGRRPRRRPRPARHAVGAAPARRPRHAREAVTAVVTVADDGGSSGRLRRELGLLPPGDLRMALDALAADDAAGSRWRALVQHRFGGTGALAGHAVGNLLLAGLMEVLGDPVAALDEVAALLGLRGRVLPMSCEPLDIEAEVTGLGDAEPGPGPPTASAARSPWPPPPAGCSGSGCARTGRGPARRRSRPCAPPTCCSSARARGSPACCRTCWCPSCATR